MQQLAVKQRWIWVACWVLVNCAGCANSLTDALPYWPFGDRERTGYLTPGKRIEQFRVLEEQAEQKSASEQEAIANDLAGQIKSEEDPLIREEIVRTIAAYPTVTSRAVLFAALKDFDANVRLMACEKLGDSRDPEVPAALVPLAEKDADVDVRLAAIQALGKYKDQAVLPAMATALDDSDPAIQHRAILTLKETSGQDFGNDVQAWRQYARGETPTPSKPTSVAEQIRSFSPF